MDNILCNPEVYTISEQNFIPVLVEECYLTVVQVEYYQHNMDLSSQSYHCRSHLKISYYGHPFSLSTPA